MGVLLDHTLFHPQGGGQPNDSGKLIGPGGIFTVNGLRIEEGRIIHLGSMAEGGTLETDQEVEMEVDEAPRRINARVHSAGHLLDVAMRRIGFEHKPGKGYHYPVGAYVEYVGKMDATQREKAMSELAGAINKIIEETAEEDAVWS